MAVYPITVTLIPDSVVYPLIASTVTPFYYIFAQEGSRMEPTRGQIWPRIG